MSAVEKHDRYAREESFEVEEPPPVLKSWRNIYLLVLANLVLCIVLFYLFTKAFK